MKNSDVGDAHTSRFSGYGRGAAMAVLGVFTILLAWGLIAGTNLPADYHSSNAKVTNVGLYNDVVEKMSHGEGYYEAIDESQAAHGFPTRPSSTVREPTLASIQTWVGGADTMLVILGVLVAALCLFLTVRLEKVAPGRSAWWAASVLGVITSALFVNRDTAAFQEYWAGILVALALLAAGRWPLSVVLGLLAAMIRELAFPLIAVMALYELLQGRKRRAAIWVGAAVVFAGFLVIHAIRIQNEVAPADYRSPGWIKYGGWPFFVDTVRYTSFLVTSPDWIGAVLVPLALLGWASRKGDFADRVILLLGSYAVAFMFVGRPGNVYWGFLYVGLLVPGLAFAPSALKTLWRQARVNREGTTEREPIAQG